jgi:tetratricopeptide (TPR) repeat protein
MKKVLLFMITFVLLLSCQSKKSSGDYFKEGEELFAKKLYDEAIEKYEEGLKLTPNSAVGYNLLGMAYRFKFNEVRDPSFRQKEIESFKKAIEIDETYWVAYINLGATYYYGERKAEAIPLFQRALELYPLNPEKEAIERMIEEAKKEGDRL